MSLAMPSLGNFQLAAILIALMPTHADKAAGHCKLA